MGWLPQKEGGGWGAGWHWRPPDPGAPCRTSGAGSAVTVVRVAPAPRRAGCPGVGWGGATTVARCLFLPRSAVVCHEWRPPSCGRRARARARGSLHLCTPSLRLPRLTAYSPQSASSTTPSGAVGNGSRRSVLTSTHHAIAAATASTPAVTTERAIAARTMSHRLPRPLPLAPLALAP